jgi:nitroimidazol reductase NimA-like FMN-containing flavoprotein (pyridoxamine 5'-phosphate oxidase superfamily)
MSTNASALEELDRDECLQLLASFSVGRVAVATPHAAPLIMPVNYVLDGEVVIFRSDPGAKLKGIDHQSISFQIDYIDSFHRTGWSVLVRGTALAAKAHEIAPLEIESWVTGAKDQWVRVVPHSITGRRLSVTSFPRDERGYL